MKLTQEQYEPFAETYSAIWSNYNQRSVDAYFRHFPWDFQGKKLLDLGCGSGHDLSRFEKLGARVYGIDGSQEMVRLARQKNPGAIIEVAPFEKIPFPDQTFDWVVSKWALQTADLIEPIYEEIARVLKPNGRLVYLACHPIRQFLEKKRFGKNYFEKEIVESIIFGGQITVREPSHTFNEYLGKAFFKQFTLLSYEEDFDAGMERVNNDLYPAFFIINAVFKSALPQKC